MVYCASVYYCEIVDSVHIIPLWHRLPIAPSNPRLPPGLGVCAKWNEGFATFQKVSPALKPLCLSNGVFDFRAVWTRRTSAAGGTTELRGKQQELEIEDWLKALGGRRRQALTDQHQVGLPLTSTLTTSKSRPSKLCEFGFMFQILFSSDPWRKKRGEGKYFFAEAKKNREGKGKAPGINWQAAALVTLNTLTTPKICHYWCKTGRKWWTIITTQKKLTMAYYHKIPFWIWQENEQISRCLQLCRRTNCSHISNIFTGQLWFSFELENVYFNRFFRKVDWRR